MKIEKVKDGYRASYKFASGRIIAIVAETAYKALLWCLWGVKKELKANK